MFGTDSIWPPLCVKWGSIELWNSFFSPSLWCVIAWCFQLFDVLAKSCRLFYISLWSRSSCRAQWYAALLPTVVTVWYCSCTADHFHITALFILFDFTLNEPEASRGDFFCPPLCNICLVYHQNLNNYLKSELKRQYFLTSVKYSAGCWYNNVHFGGLDDFLNYALCTTREHQSTFKRMKDLNASYLAELRLDLKIFQQGFVGLWNSLYGYIKTNGSSYKFTVISVCRNNRSNGEL